MKYTSLVICTLCVQTAFAADPGMTEAECQVWNRELSFAQSAANHDQKAFAEHLHANAVFSAATEHPQRGREEIARSWSDIVSGKGKVQLAWHPQYVSIGTDTHVAMSRGPYVIRSQDADGKTRIGIGDFVSVWVRKDAASPWLVVLDGGGPPPKEVSEKEASAHLAAAPASCPRAAS